MPPMPIIDSKEFIKFLHFLGFELIRQKGSHKRFKHSDGRFLTIPFHGKQNLKRGLLSGMLNEIGVDVRELINFLNKK